MLAGGPSSLYISFATSGVGQSLGLFVSAASMVSEAAVAGLLNTGTQAGTLTSFGSALGTALPWVGGALAIASLLGGFGKRGGPKSGGDYYGTLNGDGIAQQSSMMGFDYFTPADSDAAVKSLMEGAAAQIQASIRKLGGNASGVQLGLGFDTDPKGTAPNRISSAVFGAGGQEIYQRISKDLPRDANMQQEMANELNRLLLGAVRASDVDPLFRGIADGIDLTTASADQLAAAVAQLDAAANAKNALALARDEFESAVEVMCQVGIAVDRRAEIDVCCV
jgi:hypothetical protein